MNEKELDKYRININEIFETYFDAVKYIKELEKKLCKKTDENIYLKIEKVKAYSILKEDLYNKSKKERLEIENLKRYIKELDEKLAQDNKENNCKNEILSERIKDFYKSLNNLQNLKLEKIDIEDLNSNLLKYIKVYEIYAEDKNLFEKIYKKNNKFFSKKDIEKNILNILNKTNILKFQKEKEQILINKKNIYYKHLEEKEKLELKEIIEKNVEYSNNLIVNASNFLGKNYAKKVKDIIRNNRIDYFKRDGKIYSNKTINIYKGYIYLQNSLDKTLNDEIFIHEIGHLMRYINLGKIEKNILIEETFSILHEFILLEYLLNKKEKELKDLKNIEDIKENILSKIFDTAECFLFQEYILEEIRKSGNISIEKTINKRKQLLSKLGYIKDEEKYNIKKVYSFIRTYSYLRPYYSLTYFIGTFLAFNILNKIRNKKMDINYFTKNILLKDIKIEELLEFLDIKSIDEIFNIDELLSYLHNN